MTTIHLSEMPGGDPAAIADAAARVLRALAATPTLDRARALASQRLSAARQADARERARTAARKVLLEQLEQLERATE